MQQQAEVWNGRPDHTECHEYYSRYIDRVPDGDIRMVLATQIQETEALLRAVPADKETFRYAPGKWSIREVVGHIIDSERVFGYRAIHISRGDASPLPSFEQDDWARVSNAASRPLSGLVDELIAVRRSHGLFFRGLEDEDALRRGIASDREFTVRALAWIIAGHERHHAQQLVTRYLNR